MNYSNGTRVRILAGDEPEWLRRHCRRTYVRNKILATPEWALVYRAEIRRLERRRDELTRLTGRTHVLDHIIPLTHPLVCGLNVPWNIRIITGRENAARSNRWWEFTPDLFGFEPEQMRLL